MHYDPLTDLFFKTFLVLFAALVAVGFYQTYKDQIHPVIQPVFERIKK